MGEAWLLFDDVKLSGFTVLFIGVALLIFSFVVAYQFIVGIVEIASSGDYMDLFGRALSPLIAYAIRALFLGIMGWIGSILTRRGVQIITSEPKPEKQETKEPKENKEPKQPQKT
jgi:hypothetical protein